MTKGAGTGIDGGDGPAIDMAGGVERVMGDHHMFLRILKRFCSDFASAPGEIRAALAAGDAQRAQRLAHTLKGASGMIEAQALQRSALALEQALRSRPDGCAIEVGLMEAELKRALAQAGMLLAGDSVCPAAAATPALSTPDAVSRLRELLDFGNGAAVDLVANARLELVAALGAGRYGDIAAAVDRFDFEKALRLLGGAGPAR